MTSAFSVGEYSRTISLSLTLTDAGAPGLGVRGAVRIGLLVVGLRSHMSRLEILIAVWLCLGILSFGITGWVVRSVWMARETTPLAVKLLTVLAGACLMVGGVGSALGLFNIMVVLGGEGVVDPAQQARVLAENIAVVMNCTASGLVVWVPCITAVLVLRKVLRSRLSSNAAGV